MKIKRFVLSRIGPFFFLAALLLYPFTFTVALAQEMPDVIGVRMTDGSVIEGRVVKANAEVVTIRTKDGQTITRKFSDVENFVKTGESLKPSPRTRYEESPFYIGVFGGYVWTDKAKVESSGTYKFDVDDGGMMGFKLGANIPTAPFANIEVEFFHIFSQDISQQIHYSGANYIQAGPDSDVYLNNVMFNLITRYPAGNIRPYIGVGIGYSKMEIGGTYTALVNGTTYTSRDPSEDAFAYQFLAGINYRIDRYLSVDAGYRYFAADADVSGADISYRANIFTLGLNYHFW
jgi:opacity protein-like surface antigen